METAITLSAGIATAISAVAYWLYKRYQLKEAVLDGRSNEYIDNANDAELFRIFIDESKPLGFKGLDGITGLTEDTEYITMEADIGNGHIGMVEWVCNNRKVIFSGGGAWKSVTLRKSLFDPWFDVLGREMRRKWAIMENLRETDKIVRLKDRLKK